MLLQLGPLVFDLAKVCSLNFYNVKRETGQAYFSIHTDDGRKWDFHPLEDKLIIDTFLREYYAFKGYPKQPLMSKETKDDKVAGISAPAPASNSHTPNPNLSSATTRLNFDRIRNPVVE